jgi:hypothetical protein
MAFLAMGTVVVHAVVMFGLMVFWSRHQTVADVDASRNVQRLTAPYMPILRHD